MWYVKAFKKCDCPLGFKFSTGVEKIIVGADEEPATQDVNLNTVAPTTAPETAA